MSPGSSLLKYFPIRAQALVHFLALFCGGKLSPRAAASVLPHIFVNTECIM